METGEDPRLRCLLVPVVPRLLMIGKDKGFSISWPCAVGFVVILALNRNVNAYDRDRKQVCINKDVV